MGGFWLSFSGLKACQFLAFQVSVAQLSKSVDSSAHATQQFAGWNWDALYMLYLPNLSPHNKFQTFLPPEFLYMEEMIQAVRTFHSIHVCKEKVCTIKILHYKFKYADSWLICGLFISFSNNTGYTELNGGIIMNEFELKDAVRINFR